METAIWLTEVAPDFGKAGKGFLEHLANANEEANPGLMRLALKLATGAGKTTVMAMLIAWQTINAARPVCQAMADPSDACRMLALGQLYAGARDYADAVEPLRTAARLDAGSYEAWQNLGLSLYWLRRYREALPALEKAAALNPQSFDTLNLLAATFHALGNDAAALPVLERAHRLNPSDAKSPAALERMRAAQKR